jgi:pimeloyl-[acyl-carrier protein] methyl ester esterase
MNADNGMRGMRGMRNSMQARGVRDVVLLHGWGVSAAVWDDLRARLGPGFRLHAPDLPGYGVQREAVPRTLRGVAAALARAAPRRCQVVGWSLGGQVALEWAAAAPGQLAALVLIATTPSFVCRGDWPHGIDAGVLREFARSLDTDREETLRRFVLLQSRGDIRQRRVARALRAALSSRALPRAATLASGLELLLGSDLRARLEAIAQPALVVHGSGDVLTPPAAGEYLARTLTAARLAIVPGAGHAPFLSQPDVVQDLVADFLHEG